MTERLLDYNRDTGTKTWHSYDSVTKETTIRNEYDRDQIVAQIDHNKRLATAGIAPSKEMRHVARIPLQLWHHIMMTEGVDIFSDEGWSRMKKLLNDPDYLHLRIAPGRV